MKTVNLDGKWEWHKAGEEELHEGSVPGTVISDMLSCGMIGDPYWRDNEYAVREIMAGDFLYTRTFEVGKDLLSSGDAFIVFLGLDTLAEVSINGEHVLSADDMHRTWRVPVSSVLKEGRNRIEVLFRSSLSYIRKKAGEGDIHYASTGCMLGNATLRKAHYMFGWDWGPQLPDAGIWRSAYIEFEDDLRIRGFRARQSHHDGNADIKLTAELSGKKDGSASYELKASVTSPSGEVLERTAGIGEEISFHIEEPELWWPNNLGPQNLYDVKLVLFRDGEELSSSKKRIGLRTIWVDTSKDEWGSAFAFVVNGVKVFSMGANMIPEDNILTRVTPERTRRLVSDMKEANFNTVRVWGGGYYPSDAFYDACDENGIMVWQDLMFACNVYELTPRFEENIIRETEDMAERLRDHACLALWCSNNEMEWGWGDMWKRLEGHHPRYGADYIKIFEMVLPRVLERMDGDTFFWPSSPSSGGSLYRPNAFDEGDQHYWEVWHSGKPFTEYRKHHFRFCSEYGFQSFPSMKSIESFTEREDRNIFSRVMESHQKNGEANKKIFTYVADHFRYPDSLSSVAYISQVLQLMAIQYGVEHWRRNRPRCMGSLYWQLNDCWPVASWASIDYYGRWKALHYGARHFYAPVTISIEEEEELSPKMDFFLHNETLADVTSEMDIRLVDRDLSVLWESGRFTAEMKAMTAGSVKHMDFTDLIADGRDDRFVSFRMWRDGEVREERTVLFVRPKHFEYRTPDFRISLHDAGRDWRLHIEADSYDSFIEIGFRSFDTVLSDNFFSLTAPEGKDIFFSKGDTDLCADAILEDIAVKSVATSYTL